MKGSGVALAPIILFGCVLNSLHAADREFPLQLEVLDARTEAQKALAHVLDRGDGAALPPEWPQKQSGQDTESDAIRGRGYDARLYVRNWAGQRDSRLTANLYLRVARGDIRCLLGPIRWLEVRDDRGNDLIPAWQKEAAAHDPAWWQRLGISSHSPGPDNRRIGEGVDLDLPDLSVRKITVMRGFLHLVVAAKWDTAVLDRPTGVGDAVLLKDAGARVTWLREPRSEGGFADYLRLERDAGSGALPDVGGFWSRAELSVFVAPKGSDTRLIRLDFERRKGLATDYRLAMPDPSPKQLEVRVLAEAALVRVPFEFRDVPIPGTPPADMPDPFRGAPAPGEEGLLLELRAPEKVLEHGEPARVVLRLTNKSRTGFCLDRGQIYEDLSVSCDKGGVSFGEDVRRNFLDSPYKEENEDRLVSLQPGEFVDLPLVLYSLGNSFGDVTVRTCVRSSREPYWVLKPVWKGRSQEATATVRYQEAPLVELEKRLAAGREVDADVARREVEALLAPGGAVGEWRWRIFRQAPRVCLPVLHDLLKEGRGDVAMWIETCLGSESLPEGIRKELAARPLAIAEEAVRGGGPIPDGCARVYLAEHKGVSVEFLEALLTRTGKEDRQGVAWLLMDRASEGRTAWTTILRMGDEPDLRSVLCAASAYRSLPLELTRDVYVKTRDKRVLSRLILDGGRSQMDLLLDEFAQADAQTKSLILWSLAGAGRQTETLARDALESSASASERLAALAVIAAGETTEAVSLLRKVVDRDEDERVRRRAGMLLSDLVGKEPAWPGIGRIALDRAPEGVDLPAPDVALRLAVDPESLERGPALLSLAFLTQQQHLAKVRALLSSADIPVLKAAIVAGSRLRDGETASTASGLLKNPPGTWSREFLERAVATASSPIPQVPGLFMRFAPEPSSGGLRIWIEGTGWGRLRLVQAAAGEAFVLLARVKDIQEGTTSYWYIPYGVPMFGGGGRPPGTTDTFGNCGFSQVALLSDVLGPGQYEVSVDLLALTVGREEPVFSDWVYDGRRDQVFVPMWGLRRISAGPERITITEKPKDALGGPLPKRVGLEEAAPADESTAPSLRSLALKALVGRDRDLMVPATDQSAEPLLRLAAMGDRSVHALALEVAESRDPYTAWGGCAARRMLFVATQPEKRRGPAAASWLAELYRSPEEFFPAHRMLVLLLIRCAGADACRSVLVKAMTEAPDPWLQHDAAVRIRRL